VGALSDRIGPAAVLRIGVGISGATFIAMAAFGNFGVFAVVYGVVGAFGYAALAYVPIGVLVDRVFPPDRKGFFFALLTNGTAVGFIVLVPLWIWLGDLLAWQAVLAGLGLVFLLVLFPLSLTLRVGAAPAATAQSATEASRPSARLTTLLRGPFVGLALAFLACGVTMAFVDVHLISHLHDNSVSNGATSSAMVLLGVAEVIGAFIAGIACDRGHIRSILLVAYALRGTAMVIVAVSPSAASAQVFGVVFGASFLMTVVATTMWLVSSYPASMRGLVLGLLWAVHQIGAAVSSQLGASLRDITGGYDAVIYTGLAMCLVSIILVATQKNPNRSEYATETSATR
jgi:predicted MFS family arabinose efflux permease